MATISVEGGLRAGAVALWSNGGFQVVLRLPGLAVAGSDAEQLGLAMPEFADVPIGPAVWRKAGSRSALLLAGDAVQTLMGTQGFSSAESLFETAVGVVVDGVLYGITESDPLTMAGTSCAYRLTLAEPAWS